MWFFQLYRSALVKKAVMAATGLFLFGWILGHMAGNLKIFLGPEEFNHYAEFLREMGTPLIPETGVLWISRVILLVAVGLHIWSATSLTLTNRRARPEDYELRHGVQLDYAARTMRWSGYLIGVYVIYHLMHLTFGNVHPDFVPGDAYDNVVRGFQVVPVALVYVVANVLLGFHLYHGLWSMFQSLGWNHPAYNAWRRHFAITFSIVVTAGFVSIPLAVLAGILS
jgi:succinate dehydrogenase / fumarate reductase cytochrome b subunit